MKIPKNSLKIPNGLSAAVNQRKTDDTMAESTKERQLLQIIVKADTIFKFCIYM
jgi:hypothetical protein